MNTTYNRPDTRLYQESHQRFVARIEQIQAALQPSSTSSPREALTLAVSALEKLLPALSQYFANQSLLSQDWDTNGRQRMEEQLNHGRAKLRELNVLLESARRIVGEPGKDDGDATVQALNAYLGPSLGDMREELLAQAEVRTAGRS